MKPNHRSVISRLIVPFGMDTPSALSKKRLAGDKTTLTLGPIICPLHLAVKTAEGHHDPQRPWQVGEPGNRVDATTPLPLTLVKSLSKGR